MNDLLRPALYQARQEIVPAGARRRRSPGLGHRRPRLRDRRLPRQGPPLALARGDLLAVRSSGAYGFTMSSNYNSRPRAAEVMVDGDQAHLVRRRETLADLWAGEATLP
jgi:diaminopimelate decarboxylase